MKKDQVIAHYLTYLESAKKAPNWVYKFTDATEVDKENFYSHFEDINQMERQVWLRPLDSTLQILAKDQGYPDYTAREKLLAFYFTLLESLNEREQAFTRILDKSSVPGVSPASLKDFKHGFLSFVEELVREGIKSEEIENRPLIASIYTEALWLQCLFLLRFWKNDKSSSHAATDEAVERSVNLIFDLMGYTPVDAALGFARFIYRHKKLLL